jgi:hypothetical protein
LRSTKPDERPLPWPRIAVVGLLSVLLGGLTYYGYRAYPEITLADCLKDAERHDGAMITVGTEATVAQLLPDGFVVRQMGRLLRVVGNPAAARVGDFVRLRAQFHKEGYLTLERLYVAKKRRVKVAISLLPAILIVAMVAHTYRFDRRRLCFVEKKQCRI